MAKGKTFTRAAMAVTIILLLWNLIGIAAFFGQMTMDLDKLAQRDAYQAHLFATMPAWGWVAYGVAVWAGLIGTIALLARNRWAVALYWLSLIGIVLQFGRTFLMTDLIAVRGWTTGLFPGLIVAVAVYQIWFARKLRRQGILV